MHDFEEPSEPPPPPATKLSKTPSWIMLGFLLGVLFVWSLPTRETAPPPVAKQEPAPAPSPPAPPRLMQIEAVFAEWAEFASWEHDQTQVALWNVETNSFSDFFEVIRARDRYYFRSIPRLTNPILLRGIDEHAPLQFTETPAQREAWLRDVARENRRAFSEGVREAVRRKAAESSPAPPAPSLPGGGQQ